MTRSCECGGAGGFKPQVKDETKNIRWEEEEEELQEKRV